MPSPWIPVLWGSALTRFWTWQSKALQVRTKPSVWGSISRGVLDSCVERRHNGHRMGHAGTENDGDVAVPRARDPVEVGFWRSTFKQNLIHLT